jgi:hypothetical protein
LLLVPSWLILTLKPKKDPLRNAAIPWGSENEHAIFLFQIPRKGVERFLQAGATRRQHAGSGGLNGCNKPKRGGITVTRQKYAGRKDAWASLYIRLYQVYFTIYHHIYIYIFSTYQVYTKCISL